MPTTGFTAASWAKDNGLYAEVFENISELDLSVQRLCRQNCVATTKKL